MKNLLPILFSGFVILLFIVLIALESSMLMDINRTQKREVEFLLRRNEKLEQDNKSFRKCLDSLKIQIR